jgi:uncharacterized protein involved in exopolysaccharide biosynthesis/Mrp family chromosome partitioning ATPase
VTSFSYVTTLLRRRRKTILAAGLMGVVAGLSVSLIMPPRYTAKAQFVITPQVEPQAAPIDEAAVETRVESLLTAEHRRRVLDSLMAQAAAGDPNLPNLANLTDEEIARSLNAFKERRSRIVSLTFTSRDPRLAALVANRAVKLHIDDLEALRRGLVDARLDALTHWIPAARSQMERAERTLQEHRVATGIVDETLIIDDDRRIAEIKRQLAIAKSKADLRRDADKSSAADRAGRASHPAVDAISDARIRFLEAELGAAQQTAAKLLEDRVAFRTFQRDVAVAAQLHEQLVRKQADLRMADPMPPETRIVSPASPPEKPSTPNPLLFVMPTTVLALVLGAMFAFVRENSDRRIRSERDVNEMLGLTCLGLVPRLRRSERANLKHTMLSDPESPYVESIRSIAAALLDLPRPRAKCRVILVTSIASGDGKSTLAQSIAASALTLDRRVLLVDLDRSDSSQLVGKSDGCAAAVGQTVARPTSDLIRSLPEEGVDRLSLPRSGMDPLVFLADEGFSDILEECRQRYDCILIDSARPLGTTEVRMLATMADHIVLTAKWGAIRWDGAEKALSQLRLLASPEVLRKRTCVVVTQVDMKQQARFRYDAAA